MVQYILHFILTIFLIMFQSTLSRRLLFLAGQWVKGQGHCGQKMRKIPTNRQ